MALCVDELLEHAGPSLRLKKEDLLLCEREVLRAVEFRILVPGLTTPLEYAYTLIHETNLP